jgi:8-oxo-dGTP pyrophosphatase MutT (NUDIX family)
VARRDYYNDPGAPKPNRIVPAVTAAVRDERGRILMIHRTDNDRWALPGGALELGETVISTAVREVKEETGIDIEVSGLVGIYSDPHHVIAYDDGEVRQQFAICVRGRPTGGTLRGSSESTEVRWVDVDELPHLDLHPTQRLRVSHALDRSSAIPYLE